MKAGTLILRGNCPRQLRRGVGEYPQRIVQALECLDAEDGMPGQRREALPQRQQMGREIAAIYRRDVKGQQRLQRLRVVPIIEMTLITLQTGHAFKRQGGAFEKLRRAGIAKVMG